LISFGNISDFSIWSSIRRHTRITIHLNSEVVVASDWEIEESELTPVCSPGVSTDPIFFTGFLVSSPADDGNLVVEFWALDVFLVDSTVVVLLKVVGGLDSARNWTVHEELSLHFSGAGEAVVQGDVVLLVIDGPAFVLTGLADWAWWPGAVFADVDWFALLNVAGNILLT
jgi:hypothetical protein